jgi:Domain of unknown function (DUF4214)
VRLGELAGLMTVTSNGAESYVDLSGIGEGSPVRHYYEAILGREPDAGGSAYWSDQAAQMRALGANVNETWYAMALAFFSSPEYAARARDDAGFVADLYQTFFDRAPDASGNAYWTSQLAQGMPREVALVSFLLSPEFTSSMQGIYGNVSVRSEADMVTDFYRGLLRRLPDATGFAYWQGQFRQAQCSGPGAVAAAADAISSYFLDGAEYAGRASTDAQFVGDLYDAFLRRGGDLAGVRFWIDQLATGQSTREEVRRAFEASPEFAARVNAVLQQGCLP